MFQRDREVVFYDHFHQHEAIQISYIVEGEGELLAGDRIRRYQSGDAFVLGTYLPHLFRSDRTSDQPSEMISVFFSRSDLEKLAHFEEFFQLTDLMNEMDCGVSIESRTGDLGSLIAQIGTASSFIRLSLFFSLLELISESDRSLLSDSLPKRMMSENEGMRMQAVMNFTLESLSKQIKLEEVAALANMSTNAFCRYFKQRTNKSYFQFLIEIRIEHASNLLIKAVDIPIAEVAELSGFLNLSNFNRRFKKEKGMSPSEFRKRNRI